MVKIIHKLPYLMKKFIKLENFIKIKHITMVQICEKIIIHNIVEIILWGFSMDIIDHIIIWTFMKIKV